MRKLMVMAILTAMIDPVVAQVACPSPVPDQPSGEQIVACLRDIEKLRKELDAVSHREITITNMGPRGPSSDPNIAFSRNWTGPDKSGDGEFHDIPESKGFNLCAVTGFYAGSSSNEWCDLERGGEGQWRLRKTNAIVCRVKCFKLTGFVQQ